MTLERIQEIMNEIEPGVEELVERSEELPDTGVQNSRDRTIWLFARQLKERYEDLREYIEEP